MKKVKVDNAKCSFPIYLCICAIICLQCGIFCTKVFKFFYFMRSNIWCSLSRKNCKIKDEIKQSESWIPKKHYFKSSPPNECFMVVLKTRLQKQSTYKRSWVVLKRRRPLYQILTFFFWSSQLLLNKSQHHREIMHDTCTSKHRRLHNHPIASHFKGSLFKLGSNRYIEKRKNSFAPEL